MTLPKLALDINEAQYSIAPGLEVNEVQVDTGPSWRRADFFGAPNRVALQFVTSEPGYDYLMAFWRTRLRRGLLPFLIDLVIDGSDMREYQVVLTGGGALQAVRQGSSYFVTGALEVKRSPAETSEDENIIFLYETYGDVDSEVLNRLAKLVNVDFPAALQ